MGSQNTHSQANKETLSQMEAVQQVSGDDMFVRPSHKAPKFDNTHF